MNQVAGADLLKGPIASRLLGLAWPVLVVLALLAGVALVFPLFMLMTMMSNGGIGGGISSAVARAILPF